MQSVVQAVQDVRTETHLLRLNSFGLRHPKTPEVLLSPANGDLGVWPPSAYHCQDKTNKKIQIESFLKMFLDLFQKMLRGFKDSCFDVFLLWFVWNFH